MGAITDMLKTTVAVHCCVCPRVDINDENQEHTKHV